MGGKSETIQRDVDGILTTPAWDKNETNPIYEYATFSGSTYRLTVGMTSITPEGTTYVYEKHGYYTTGEKPWDNPSATAEPSNILKIATATDRNGNVTHYTYGTGTVTFDTANGSITENPLTQVSMPNGHTLDFTWTGNRITSVTDGFRTVNYGYTSGLLTSVTSPAGYVTTYGYSDAYTVTAMTPDMVAHNLLTSITDCRGLTTSIQYTMNPQPINHLMAGYGPCVIANFVQQPNGVRFVMHDLESTTPPPTGGWTVTDSPRFTYYDSTGATMSSGFINTWLDTSLPELHVEMRDFSLPAVTGDPIPEVWTKVYDTNTLDLLTETHVIWPYRTSDLHTSRQLDPVSFWKQAVQSDTSYNFFGGPLKKTVQEINWTSSSSSTVTRTDVTDYAYWGADKYFQQKAVKDNAGRYSYTDYYDSSASAGSRGQQYRVYGPKYTTYYEDTSITPPAGTLTANYWKYRLKPTDATQYSGQLVYDSKGRATDVYKLHDATTTPYTYVQTKSVYGADSSPWWGSATTVTEDYGGINRITETLANDSCGRPTEVQDGAGHQFVTDMDLDGRIDSVTRVDCSPNKTIATYVYGSSGISSGQPVEVTDGLSGVVQDISYATSGGGIGSPSSVVEDDGATSYTDSYTYLASGDRATARYDTPDSDLTWRYSDYVSAGDPSSATRVFQTLNKQVSGANSTEELHYQYDSSGRLSDAGFAQTPQGGQTDYSEPAATLARAYYAYDPAGRILSLEHYWDTFCIPPGSSSGYYTSQTILANSCVYDSTTGLKTSSSFYVPDTPGTGWTLQRTEEYGYDPDLDCLTSADYDDGLPNATVSWTYDAAGNRISDSSNSGTWSYDALDRMTASPGLSYSNDILGNRTGKGSSISYGWDELNRMSSYTASSAAMYYTYRSDGMRVAKTDGTNSTTYRYDGRSLVELSLLSGSSATTQASAVGPRDIDIKLSIASGGSVPTFPLYDAHGNLVAELSRSGGSCLLSNQFSFDCWGDARSSPTSPSPAMRHCANLGHVADDESGSIYMRARYVEPATGRFLSEDRHRNGLNWFLYADDCPTCKIDASGNDTVGEQLGAMLFMLGFVIAYCGMAAPNPFTASLEIQSGFQVLAAMINDVKLGLIVAKSIGEDLQWALRYAAQNIRNFVWNEDTAAAFGGLASRAALALGGEMLMAAGLIIEIESVGDGG